MDVGFYAYSLVNQRFCMEWSATSMNKECLGKGKTCFKILALIENEMTVTVHVQ